MPAIGRVSTVLPRFVLPRFVLQPVRALRSPGYLMAVWLELLGAFLMSGRPQGPRKTIKKPRGFALRILESFPGPRGRPDLQNEPKKLWPDRLYVHNLFRSHVGFTANPCPIGPKGPKQNSTAD
jgi:hypothetical protein